MLSISVFSVVGEYMSILLFICLPVIVLSIGLAIFLHYRQKRRRKLQASEDVDKAAFTFSTLTDAAQLVTLSPLANEDKFNLVKECRKQLAKSKAKFLALRHDFLINPFASSKEKRSSISIDEYNNHMQNLQDKVVAYEKQIAELQNKLEVLATVFPSQDEAHFLRLALQEKDLEIAQLKQLLTERSRSTSLYASERIVETLS